MHASGTASPERVRRAPDALHRVGSRGRRRRPHAVGQLAERARRRGRHASFAADANLARERQTAAGRLDLSHRRRASPARKSTIECTPIVVDGVMYITTVKSKVVALDAATGQAKWTFDPYSAERRLDDERDERRESRRRVLEGREIRPRAASFTARPMAACSRSTPRPARCVDGFAAKGILDAARWHRRRPRHLEAHLRRHVRARRLRRSRHRRLRRRRRSGRVAARRHPRVRRAHGQGTLALPHRAAARRVRARHVGRRRRGRIAAARTRGAA